MKRLKPEIINHKGDLQSFQAEVALLRKLANRWVRGERLGRQGSSLQLTLD